MARLGRRGIVLSLFINALNIALYIIIFIAACFNIVEASVNFIILNGSAVCISCLLIVSEIRLPQLTYEYFRFLCTYRGRGLTYIFFGCLVATPIPFNLYGGIVVVCMGLAFFIMSFITLIPPLDGLMLNYRKLDEWREQRHFRIQLEAQRIYEQQLQQEQALAGLIPHHLHTNGHATQGSGGGTGGGAFGVNGMASPKQYRLPHVGGGIERVMNNIGPTLALRSIFSPPMTSSITKVDEHSASESRLSAYGQASMAPKDMTNDGYTEVIMEPVEDKKLSLSARISSAAGIGRGKGRSVGGLQESLGGRGTVTPKAEHSEGLVATMVGIDKELPPIVTRATIEHPTYAVPTTFTLTPTPTTSLRSGDTTPHSITTQEESKEYLTSSLANGSGSSDGPMFTPGSPLYSAPKTIHSNLTDTDVVTGTKLGGNQHPAFNHSPPSSHKMQGTAKTVMADYPLPLRLNNKPTPPYDPFRKVNHHSPSHTSSHTAFPYTATTVPAPTATTSVLASISQSIYQPPEQSRFTTASASARQTTAGFGRGPDSRLGEGEGEGAAAALHMTDQSASHGPTPEMKNGIREPTAKSASATTTPTTPVAAATQWDANNNRVYSGGYGMVGITAYATKPSATVPYPRPPNFSHKTHQQQHHYHLTSQHHEEQPPLIPRFQFQADGPDDCNDMAPMAPGHGQERNYRSGEERNTTPKVRPSGSCTRVGMPEIVLTLPTPGETYSEETKGDGYFSIG